MLSGVLGLRRMRLGCGRRVYDAFGLSKEAHRLDDTTATTTSTASSSSSSSGSSSVGWPTGMVELLESSWSGSANSRPSFERILKRLHDFEEGFKRSSSSNNASSGTGIGSTSTGLYTFSLNSDSGLGESLMTQ